MGVVISVIIIIILLAPLIGIGVEIDVLRVNRKTRPLESKGRKKKIAGLILFEIGIIASIYGVASYYGAAVAEHYNEMWYALISAFIGVLSVFIGIILFFVGKREIGLQRNPGQSREPRL